jgi:hypothetical protein
MQCFSEVVLVYSETLPQDLNFNGWRREAALSFLGKTFAPFAADAGDSFPETFIYQNFPELACGKTWDLRCHMVVAPGSLHHVRGVSKNVGWEKGSLAKGKVSGLIWKE